MAYQDDAGELRHRITFQRFNSRRDALGTPQYHKDENWTDVATVWAKVQEITSGEFYRAEQSDSYITHNIKIRYRTDLAAEMRVRWGARVFRIVSPPIDLTGSSQWMQIKAQELVE